MLDIIFLILLSFMSNHTAIYALQDSFVYFVYLGTT